MKNLTKWFAGLILFWFAFTLASGYFLYQTEMKKRHEREVALRAKYVGRKFPLDLIIDRDSQRVDPEIFKRKPHTIIDFWFIGCAPCIQEMKKFPSYLTEQPDLQIISVNIDRWSLWKKLLNGERKHLANVYKDMQYQSDSLYQGQNNFQGLAFLSEPYKDWRHLSKIQIEGSNFMSGQGMDILSYPTYVLVNSQGVIENRFEHLYQYFHGPALRWLRLHSGFLYTMIVKSFFAEGNLIAFLSLNALLVYVVITLVYLALRRLIKKRRRPTYETS